VTDLDRRTTMVALAGTLAATSAIATPVAKTVPPRGERHLPAQTRWSLPPPLKPAHEVLARLPDTSLYYQDTGGAGEVVVLLHAYTGSYAVWGYQQSAFAAAGYRVLTYSARNHYKSAAMDPKAPGTSTGDLRALLNHLDIRRAHIVGTAGGALAALDYALSHPDRTISVTLASSHMGISDPSFLAIGARMFPRGVYGISHSFSEVGPSYRAGYPEGLAEWQRLDEIAWQGGDLRQEPEKPLTFARMEAELRVPTLLITGDADLMMPPSRMRAVAPHMPGAELVFVAEAGHSLHWEQPEAFNGAVLDFLRRHRDRAQPHV